MKSSYSTIEPILTNQESLHQYLTDSKREVINYQESSGSISNPFGIKEKQLKNLFANESGHFNVKLTGLAETQPQKANVQLGNILPNSWKSIENTPNLSELQLQKSEVLSSNIFSKQWKNIENISSRLIDTYDDIVKLECLIDKENELYEEREFKSSLFEGYELKIGNLFLIRIFERTNEMRIEIHNDPTFALKNDFPEFSFFDNFKNSSLFKGK